MLMRSLSTIVRCGNIFTNRKLKVQNIGYSESAVLMFLAANDTVNQEAIANYFMLDKGTVAKTLNNLQSKGLVSRTENPDNRREKIISLTQLGRENICTMRQLLQEWNSELFEGISDEEMAVFNNTINKMKENAKRAINNYDPDNKTYADYEGLKGDEEGI